MKHHSTWMLIWVYFQQKLTGTRDGEGIQINKDSIVMNDNVTNGIFEVIFSVTL